MNATVEQLESLLEHLSTLWEAGEPCVDFDDVPVSNGEYDTYIRQLRELAPDSEVLSRIAPSLESHGFGDDLIAHDPPMTSISKADGPNKVEILTKWLSKNAGESGFAVSHKLDGVAARIYYVDGKLVRAGLRPSDGVMGLDITENIKYVANVPQELPEPFTIAFGGEIVCKLSDFEKVQEDLKKAGLEPRKNPRNHACGAINQKLNPENTRAGRLTFIPYNVPSATCTEVELAAHIRGAFGLEYVPVHYCKTPQEVFDLIPILEEETKTVDFETDGLVIKVNDIVAQKALGHVGDNPTDCPRGAIAWKYDEESKVSTVKCIEWETSRTGKLFPVAILDPPVELAGTTVTRVSCCNYGWMREMQIGLGSRVHVIKAGKIIPKIIKSENDGDPSLPKTCACGSKIETVTNDKSGAQFLQCTNLHCTSLKLDRHLHFFSTIGAKGVGEFALKTIKGAENIGDYYRKTVEQLIADGLTPRQSLLFMSAIRLIKPVDDNVELARRINVAKPKLEKWELLKAIGIPSLGTKVAKSLMTKYGSYELLREQSVWEITQIEGVGDITATKIVAGLSALFEELMDVQQFFVLESIQAPTAGSLLGKTFVLSGTLEGGKAKWEKAITEQGGIIGSSVTKTTTYLIAGDGSGSKTEKAQKYGVSILTLNDLKAML